MFDDEQQPGKVEDIFAGSESGEGGSPPKETPEQVMQPPSQDIPSAPPSVQEVAPVQPTSEPQIGEPPQTALDEAPPILETRGRGGKRIVIIIVIILILIIGFGGVLWYLNFYQPKDKADSTIIPEAAAPTTQPSEQPSSPSPTVETTEPSPTPLTPSQSSQPPVITTQDSDHDGLSDDEELSIGTSILNVDTDSDGLFDFEEVRVYETDPLNSDSDGDGFSDGEEIQNGYNPNGPGKLQVIPGE